MVEKPALTMSITIDNLKRTRITSARVPKDWSYIGTDLENLDWKAWRLSAYLRILTIPLAKVKSGRMQPPLKSEELCLFYTKAIC